MNFFKRSVTVIAALGALSLLAPPAFAGFNVIDFDKTDTGSNIVDGQIINDEYLANFGVTISGCNWNGNASNTEFKGNICNTASGNDIANKQVAFDTNNNKSEDNDLEFNNTKNDYKSEYTALNIGDYQGSSQPNNILIIQESKDQDCSTTICDAPNDEGGQPAGFFEFNFDQLVDIVSIDFFDIEENNTNSEIYTNRISFYEGNDEKSFGFVPQTGDGSFERTAFNVTGINRLVIRMPGSGGIDNLVFRTGHADVPAPASIAVLLLGIAALSFRKIRG